MEDADIPLSNFVARKEFRSDSEQLIRFFLLLWSQDCRPFRSREYETIVFLDSPLSIHIESQYLSIIF
jgi:hypothetical protein